MFQQNLLNYESSKDYSVLKNWLSYFETQISSLTGLWTRYYDKGQRPEMSLSRIEESLKKNFSKRDYCANLIAAKLPAGESFEERILQ
jgi:hypothetical protein